MTSTYREYILEPIEPSNTSYTTGNSAQVTFRWSSSDQREWIPTRSYLLMDVLLTKADDAAHAEADAVTVLKDWPQRIPLRWSHKVAGNQVQTADSPLASHLALKLTEVSYAHSVTVGGRAFGGVTTTPFNGALTTLGVAVRPPLALWYSPVGVRGANHELSFSLPSSTELPAQIYTTPTTHKASITNLRLFVAMAERQKYLPIPAELEVKLKNVAIYTSSRTIQNRQLIETFTVPESTYHVMVWLALEADTRLYPAPLDITSVGIRFRGVSKPSVEYDNISLNTSDKDKVRAFLDSMSENRALNPEYDNVLTYADWTEAPVYSFDCSHRSNSTEKELQLRGITASANNCVFVIACLHNSRIDMTTKDSRVVSASFVLDSI